MEKTESENTDTKLMGLTEGKAEKAKRKPSVSEIKKKLGLDTPVIQQPIRIKRDGKHLYQVAGYFYPLRPETIDRLNIPPQKILFEVDREQWHREMNEVKENQDKNPKEYIDPWDK